ncbi:metallophosphoesterase [Aquibacillus saliphilus]|uniref:metallophosphoesterase n=1 Tax=Aquibacillus saliphilus TaxID=1909422 RepID=UPI001CF01283|nr:metallophosphoesterase [Aquibacillus saliphilus]
MDRRSFLKKLAASTLALLGSGGGTYYYAREIEPSMLTIHQEKITSPKIIDSFNQFTIAQFSDTHIGFHYTLDQFAELVTTLNDQKPDVVVFTGDLVDAPNEFNWDNQLIKILSSIKAPYGKFWIYGNHDHGGYGTEIVKEAMDKGGFTLLKNTNTIVSKNGKSIALVGLDDAMLGSPDIDQALDNLDSTLLTIVLVHEPDYADIVKNYPVDVQLSGHSHGGQIQIPFLGHLYTPSLAEKYVEGKYTFSNAPLELHVSRGIGTTRLPYRFLCRPEITLFQLEN